MRKRVLLIILFISLIISGLSRIYADYREVNLSKKVYEKIKDNNVNDINFDKLKLVNKDIIGWISIKSLDIDYPLVQGEDNDFYLTHLANKKENKVGSIFLDYHNSAEFNDFHSVIYGHYTYKDSMFTNLMKYKDKTFLKDNSIYYIYLPNKTLTIKIIGAFSVKEDSNIWNVSFKDAKGYRMWLNQVKKEIDEILELSEKDRIVTLATCDEGSTKKRFIVIGKIES